MLIVCVHDFCTVFCFERYAYAWHIVAVVACALVDIEVGESVHLAYLHRLRCDVFALRIEIGVVLAVFGYRLSQFHCRHLHSGKRVAEVVGVVEAYVARVSYDVLVAVKTLDAVLLGEREVLGCIELRHEAACEVSPSLRVTHLAEVSCRAVGEYGSHGSRIGYYPESVGCDFQLVCIVDERRAKLACVVVARCQCYRGKRYACHKFHFHLTKI